MDPNQPQEQQDLQNAKEDEMESSPEKQQFRGQTVQRDVTTVKKDFENQSPALN